MAKVLNIDALQKEERTITLQGASYPMKEISVEDFLKLNDLINEANEIAKTSDDPNSVGVERVKFLIESIRVSFPTCPKSALHACTFPELTAISDFARDGTLPDGITIDADGNLVEGESTTSNEPLKKDSKKK